MEMVLNIISIALIVLLFCSRTKWKITTLSLIYYMEKKQYKQPDENEMKDCIDFVVRNTIKDITGH